MPTAPETIERLRRLHAEADDALNAAEEALRALARALREAGDDRACNALYAYAIPSIDGWVSSDDQCGGLRDAERSIDALESGDDE